MDDSSCLLEELRLRMSPHVSESLENRVALVTGANAGIGRETVRGLAEAGMQVIMVCRDRKRGEEALDDVQQTTGSQKLHLMLADLSSQGSIRKLVEDDLKQFSALNVLINNAAVITSERELTGDGIERQFAVNHLAPFLLTNLLLDKLKRSAPSRIINVSSQMHQRTGFDFENLQGEKSYHPRRIYAQSKLANVLFTKELARRLQGTGVTANALHPGTVATGLFGRFLGLPRWLRFLSDWYGISPEEGAENSIYLATSPEAANTTGEYFKDKRPYPSNPIANDPQIAERLWELSERMTGLKKPA
jgi:NAD(P)-dependent dehydrogenase (short-subunit alcohol dehydrogenase family)